MIDAKTTPAGGKELLEDVAKITPKPVKTVILTHSDADHVNGLVFFPKGITIIAQENNRKEQEAALLFGKQPMPAGPLSGFHSPIAAACCPSDKLQDAVHGALTIAP